MQKRRRIIAIVLTAALSGTMLPANSLTMYAADKLSPAKSIRADVDKTKFTHKEWTGTDYTDVEGKKVTGEDVFGINREDATTTLIPYQILPLHRRRFGIIMPEKDRNILNFSQETEKTGI